jgi:hypothetical protein
MPVYWYTHVKAEIAGRASKGAAPVDLTLEIYDSGVLAGSAHESGAVLGREYVASLELGSVNGNAAGLNLGEHTLQGKIKLINPKGSVEYDTNPVTIGIGQVPVGEVM